MSKQWDKWLHDYVWDIEHCTRLYACKNKREIAIIKRECKKWLPPQLDWSEGDIIEEQITSPSMDIDICFNEYYLLWYGGILPYEPGGNKSRRENKYFHAFQRSLIFIFFCGTKDYLTSDGIMSIIGPVHLTKHHT
jgi:hypothetical protein